MRTLLAAAVLTGLTGCLLTDGTAPKIDKGPVIKWTRSYIMEDSLYLDAKLRLHGDFQVLVNADMKLNTGYSHGYDLVIRGSELNGKVLPVRVTLPDCDEPGSGGWGKKVGYGRAQLDNNKVLHIVAPVWSREVDWTLEILIRDYYEYTKGHAKAVR